MFKTITVLTVTGALFIFNGCQSQPEPVSFAKDQSLSIALALECNSDGPVASSATVKVWADDLDTITESLTVEDCKVTGDIENIPAGNDRNILIEIFDNDQQILYTGRGQVDVYAGYESDVVIKLTRTTGSINVTGIMCTDDAKPFVPDDKTLALYHFDETEGTVLVDAMEKWNGTNSGADRVTGIWGNSLSFASGDFAKFDTIIPNNSVAGTVEFYVQFGSDLNEGSNYSIFGNDGSRIQFIYKNDSLFFMKNHSDIFKFVNSSFHVTTGKWYHIAGTWGPKGMRLYIDGSLKASSDDKSVYQSSPRGTAENVFYIGNKTRIAMEGIGLSESLYFTGKIEEIRISSVERY